MYLKPNVVIEPLVDKWYAWTHLIFPATAAMNIAFRHLKIMHSYIQAPQIHFAAANNPKMLGGPFMNYRTLRTAEVKSLIEETQSGRKHMLELATAIKDLDSLLKKHRSGQSLEPLYAAVPDLLKGYVELLYDLNHNPSYRFFEHLLYKSAYYDPSAQTVAMWLTVNDERPFVLSTARLHEQDAIELNIPLADPLIDILHRMRKEPMDEGAIGQALGLPADKLELFRSFLTEERPASYNKYTGENIRMRYFGHACILIETADISILVDPVISYYGYQTDVSRFSYSDLPDEIDYVLITHNHQDHILLETMLSLRHKVKKIIVPRTGLGSLQDPNLKVLFNMIGFMNVWEIQEMETIGEGPCRITGLPFLGEHGDLDIQSKICYNVQINGLSILFMADSCNVEPRLYDHIARLIDPVDLIFLGMECDGAPYTWVYGPLINGEVTRDVELSRRLAGSNYERGKALVETFQPRELYVYAMGLEPWVEFISSVRYREDANPIVASNKLISYCSDRGIQAERLFGEKEIVYAMGNAYV